MGLLGDSFDDPKTLGLLQIAGSLMSPGSFGTNLARGVGAYQNAMQEDQASKLKQKLVNAQIEDIMQQAALRKAQEAKMSQAQAMLSQVLGAPGAENQYGTPGSGLSINGVREQMRPQAGGLASATPEQIASLKASGIDISNLWELTRFGKEMQPGYRRNADGSMSYFGDPTKGIQFDVANNRVSLIPGSSEAQASLAGATAGATTAAQEAAKAPYTMVPVYSDGKPGVVPLSSLVRLGGQPPGNVPKSQVAEDLQDPSTQFSSPAVKAAVMKAAGMAPPPAQGGFVQTGPSNTEKTEQAANQEYAVASAKDLADFKKNLNNADFAAPGKIAKLQMIGKLFDDYEGGKLSEAGMNIASAANSIGLKIDRNLPNKEAAVAMANEIALQLRDPSTGGGMPGSLSNADRDYLKSMVPGLSQTAQGRRQLIDMQVAVHQRQQEVAQAARNYEKKYGKIDQGFFSQLAAWANAHPLFGNK